MALPAGVGGADAGRVEREGVRAGMLHCALRLGDPAGPGRGPETQSLTTTLRFDGREYGDAEGRDTFEDALHDLQRALPRDVRLRACVACAWSDYNPVGTGFMAGPACVA